MDGKLFPPDLLKLNIKIPRKNQLQSAQSAVPYFNLADGPAHALNAVAWQQLAARPPCTGSPTSVLAATVDIFTPLQEIVITAPQ